MFDLRVENKFKLVLYFLIMSMLIALPHNIAIINNEGWDVGLLNFSLIDEIPEWYPDDLADDCMIGRNGLICDTTVVKEYFYKDYTFIFNLKETYDFDSKTIVFKRSTLEFHDGNGNKLVANYQNFGVQTTFSDLKAMPLNESILFFSNGIKNSFNNFTIFYSVLINTMTTLLMTTIYLIVVSALAMLLKFGHKKYMSYFEMLGIFILSMTISTVIILLAGLFGFFAFNSIIFQFGTPIIALLVLLKIARHEYS
jgi:hypothetical protein